ncbi:MAG TPA: SpoIIE family protein phosphatase [Holophagaceae bacterium]
MSPTLKRIRWRLIWISVLALGFALGSFYVNQWQYAQSDDECAWVVEHGKIVIREVLPDGVAEEAGLLEGDELVAIQGHHFKPTREGTLEAQRLINSRRDGTILIYTLRRQGRLLQLPLRLVKHLDLFQVALLINGLIAWAISLLVVVSASERKSSRHFFYLASTALVVSGYTISGNVPNGLILLISLMGGAAMALLPALLVHFFLRFPYPFELRKNRRLLRALYVTYGVMGLVLMTLELAYRLKLVPLQVLGLESATKPHSLAGMFWSMAFWLPRGLYLVSGLASLACFVAGFRRVGTRLRRALVPSLVVATAICVDLVAMYILQAKFGSTQIMFRMQRWIFMLPMPLLPLSFAYAIFRHGLFDVRKTLLRWVTYFAVLGLTLSLYVGGLAWIFSRSLSEIPAGWAGALVGLLALPLGWGLRWLLRAIRKRFRRDLASAREAALSALREPKRRFSEEAMLKSVAAALRDAFRPQLLEVLPVEDRRLVLPMAESLDRDERRVILPPASLKLPAGLIRMARESQELVLGLGSEEADWIREQGAALRTHIDALGAQLLLLLMANDEPHTAILLGGKYAALNNGREDRELLREVALAAGMVLETALLHRRTLAQERLSQELETARKIQEGLIPSDPPAIPGFHVALRLEPALETGGDLLFVKRRPNGTWLAAVGDVCGKGLAAALYMAQATALLEMATQREDQPLETMLPALDQALRHLLGQRGFLTLALVEWNDEGRFRLARAGHPGALLLDDSTAEGARELIPKGRGLGLRPVAPGDWEILEGTLPPRGWLVLYSDGLSEAMSRQGELYGTHRLCAQLRRLWGIGSPRAACEAVFRDVAAFDAQNRDDRTLFILGREA